MYRSEIRRLAYALAKADELIEIPEDAEKTARRWMGASSPTLRKHMVKYVQPWFKTIYPQNMLLSKLYRGVVFHESSTETLRDLLSGTGVKLRKNVAESWSYSFDAAEGFMDENKPDQASFILKQYNVKSDKVILDYVWLAKQLMADSFTNGNGLKNYIGTMVLEEEVVTESVCTKCYAEEIVTFNYSADEDDWHDSVDTAQLYDWDVEDIDNNVYLLSKNKAEFEVRIL